MARALSFCFLIEMTERIDRRQFQGVKIHLTLVDGPLNPRRTRLRARAHIKQCSFPLLASLAVFLSLVRANETGERVSRRGTHTSLLYETVAQTPVAHKYIHTSACNTQVQGPLVCLKRSQVNPRTRRCESTPWIDTLDSSAEHPTKHLRPFKDFI